MDAGRVTRWGSMAFGVLLLIVTLLVMGAIERQLREVRDATTPAAGENGGPSAAGPSGDASP